MNRYLARLRKKDAEEKRRIYILRRVVFVSVTLIVLFTLISAIFINSSIPTVVYQEPENTPNNELFTEFLTPEPTNEPISILIYHTHNDESYYKGNKNYIETDIGRSFDEKYNVIAVGEALKNKLERYGFIVEHDKSDNVSDGFDYAYDTSLKNIKKRGKNYDIYIDLHRDAYAQTSKNYIKNALNQEYAFVRFVVANGKKYKENPNYKTNYKFAEELNNKMNLILPGIAKDIFVKDARLNQHLSGKCLLIEIGNEKNDLGQVINSTDIIAKALSEIT